MRKEVPSSARSLVSRVLESASPTVGFALLERSFLITTIRHLNLVLVVATRPVQTLLSELAVLKPIIRYPLLLPMIIFFEVIEVKTT